MTTKPGDEREGISEKAYEALDASSNKSKVGHGGYRNVEPIITYDPSHREKIITQDDSHIVLGGDRISSKASGYAGKGHTKCHMIDLVVGRDPKLSGNPSFKGDAARIYICQRTDADHSFDLVKGEVGSNKARSAIGIKADGVRIVAREGIKLVTMGKGTELSTGSKLKTYTGIDLIAGNDDKGLEPIALTHKLEDTFEFMLKEILEENIFKALADFINDQSSLNNEIIATLIQTPESKGKMIASALAIQLQGLAKVNAGRMAGIKFRLRHLAPNAKGWFGSRNNHSN